MFRARGRDGAAPLLASPWAMESGTARAWRVGRIGLTLLLAGLVVLGVLPAPNAIDDTVVSGCARVLVLVLLPVLCAGWWRWWWRGRAAYAALAVMLASSIILTVPAGLADFVALVGMLLGSAMLGLSGRGGLALVIIGLDCMAAFVITTYQSGWYSGTIDATVSFVLFAGLAGFGALFGKLERARNVAVERGAELSAANARLRARMPLERDLVLAQERARTARELHDGLSRGLALVGSSIEAARGERETAPDRAWQAIARAAATNTEALETMRLWARALNPPSTAYGVGGAAAFDDVAEAFRGTGLDVRVSHHGDEESLPGPVGVFATRLIQEGLTNVLRHARARRVDIDIVQSRYQVRIAVRDDGVGLVVPTEGFGLRSLRERAVALGGRLVVDAPVTGGSEIAAVLPLDWEG
ncbi:MAG: histidine kinase [Dermatophilaceae bacterium]